jgi:hypothetical protein
VLADASLEGIPTCVIDSAFAAVHGAYSKAFSDMTFLWILLAIVYVACWVYFGLTTLRKGHYWMFWIGFFFPILWLVGALIAPTPRVAGTA